jgi:hypothetical protein
MRDAFLRLYWRMKRRLLNFLTALSLLLCVAVVALWVRSYVTTDAYPFMRDGEKWEVTSFRGRLWVSNRPQVEEVSRQYELAMKRHFEQIRPIHAESDRIAAERDRAMDRLARSPGDYEALEEYDEAEAAWAAQLKRLRPPGAPRPRLVSHSVSLIVLALGWALLPSVWLVPQAMNRRRVLKRLAFGLCWRCGYDVRTTPGRCPECGAAPPAATESL